MRATPAPTPCLPHLSMLSDSTCVCAQVAILAVVVGERVRSSTEAEQAAQLRLRVRDVDGHDFVDMYLDKCGGLRPPGAFLCSAPWCSLPSFTLTPHPHQASPGELWCSSTAPTRA